MKTKSSTKILILAAACLLSFPAQAQKSAAEKKLDLDLHYDLKPASQDANLENASPAPRGLKKSAALDNKVNEEKNISPEDNRFLANPYHRTVRTGLNF